MPYYLAMGMTPEEYWHGDVWLVKHYRKAQEIKNEEVNANAWLHGRYVYDALCVSLVNAFDGKGKKYPEPYNLHPKPKTAEEIREEVCMQLDAWAERFNNE